MTKIKRKAFNIYAMIAGITLMAVTGTVVVPSAQNYYIKQQVKETVAKEKLLANLYQQYYLGDSSVVTMENLVDNAVADGILPANTNTANFLDNGFGGQFELDITDATDTAPAQFTVDSNMQDSTNNYAQIAYTTMTTSTAGVSSKNGDKNTYAMIDLTDDEKRDRIARESSADENSKNDLNKTFNGNTHISEADSLLAENQIAGKEWWEYDAKTDTFNVKTWDTNTNTWTDNEIISSKGREGHENEYVKNINELEAKDFASGTKRIDAQGIEHIAIDGHWQTKPSAVSKFVEVPDNIERFKDLVDRESILNYYNGKIDETTIVDDIWDKNIKFTKSILFWKSDKTNIPNYADDKITTEQTIYLADDLATLPFENVDIGDVAFLRKNNNIEGYKGIQEKDNGIGKLYPEAVYYTDTLGETKWRYYAPNIGDVLRLGYISSKYYTQDTNGLIEFGGYDGLGEGFSWWSDKDYNIIATQGHRVHFPSLDSVKYRGADKYLSAQKGDTIKYPIHSATGAISTYKYTNYSNLIEWGYVKAEDEDLQTTNFLSDVLDGQESEVSTSNGDQQLLQINKYSGNYVLAYSNSSGVKAMIYAGTGLAITTEELNVGDGTEPTLARLNNGNFVIAWNDSGVIKAQIYSENGEALLNHTLTVSESGTASHPSVSDTLNSPTKFVVAWESTEITGDDSDSGIGIRDYEISSAGGVISTGEICASPTSMWNNNGHQHKPKLIELDSDKGDFLLAYENGDKLKTIIYDATDMSIKDSQNIAGKTNISLARWKDTDLLKDLRVGIVSNNGNDISVVDILLSDYSERDITISGASNPTISYNMSKGNEGNKVYVVAYEKGNDIRYTTYKEDLNIRNDNIQLNTKYTNGTHTNPKITTVINDTFAVTWEASGISGSVGKDILAKTLYIKPATIEYYNLQSEFKINNINKTGDQINPVIVSLREKYNYTYFPFRYIGIAWSGKNDGSSVSNLNQRLYTISNYKYLERNNED